jgi:nitroreductase
MEWNQDIQTLIRNRISIRTYEKRMVDPGQLAELEDFIRDLTPGPFSNGSFGFLIQASSQIHPDALKNLGTYGIIRNPAGFIIGKVKPLQDLLVDYGFQMECILLRLTAMKLGTCWLGGTFHRSRFEERFADDPEVIIPAVISFGHSSEKRTIIDRTIRWGAGSKKRKAWEKLFFAGDFRVPLSPRINEGYDAALEMVRLAPSASNRQPWRIVRDNKTKRFQFYIQRDPDYQRTIKTHGMADLQLIDMGIAMAHFELSVRAQGFTGRWVKDTVACNCPENTQYLCTWYKV